MMTKGFMILLALLLGTVALAALVAVVTFLFSFLAVESDGQLLNRPLVSI